MSEPGKSPRQFSNEFKERIVLRLEAGERIAAVAEEAGVKRKLLYQWREAYRAFGAAGFNRKRGPKRGWKERRASEGRAASAPPPSPGAVASASQPSDELRKAQARIADLERVIGRQQADLQPCGFGTRPARTAARPPLRGHRKNDRARVARLLPGRRQHPAPVRFGRRLPRRLLSPFRPAALSARGRRRARSDPARSAREPPLRLSADRPGAAPAGPDRQRQARTQTDARGQPARPAHEALRPTHQRQPTRLRDPAEPRARPLSHRPRPT